MENLGLIKIDFGWSNATVISSTALISCMVNLNGLLG